MEYQLEKLRLPNEGTFLDVAVEGVRKAGLTDPHHVDPNERTLLIAGSPSSGKTTLINKFLYGTEQRLGSSAKLLEYYSSPSSSWPSDDNYNKTCHVWELEDLRFGESLQILLNSPKLTGVICFDLSRPQYLSQTFEITANIFKDFARQRKDGPAMAADRRDRVPSHHQDISWFDPFPIPLVIIGMKYDIFHRLEPEEKKTVSQWLRFVSHTRGAHLLYWTDRNTEVSREARAVLRGYAYGTELSTTKKTDYNKAIVVPPYADRLIDIGNMADHSLEKYTSLLQQHFPQENPLKDKATRVPADDPIFAEPLIDLARSKAQASWRSNI